MALIKKITGFTRVAKAVLIATASAICILGFSTQAFSATGQITVVSTSGTKCLDVIGGSNVNGTGLQVWDCNGGAAQQWTYNAANKSLVNASGKCLDVPGATTANGTRLQVWDCNGGTAQQWTYTAPSGPLKNQNGSCLDDANDGGNGSPVQIWSCLGNQNQNWNVSAIAAPLPAPSCSSVAMQSSTTSAITGTLRTYAYGVQNATTVQFPTWGDTGGQDDIIWYNGINDGGGTWHADIDLSRHKTGNPEYGAFHTHVYVQNSSASIFCGAKDWTRTQADPPPTGHIDQVEWDSGQWRVTGWACTPGASQSSATTLNVQINGIDKGTYVDSLPAEPQVNLICGTNVLNRFSIPLGTVANGLPVTVTASGSTASVVLGPQVKLPSNDPRSVMLAAQRILIYVAHSDDVITFSPMLKEVCNGRQCKVVAAINAAGQCLMNSDRPPNTFITVPDAPITYDSITHLTNGGNPVRHYYDGQNKYTTNNMYCLTNDTGKIVLSDEMNNVTTMFSPKMLYTQLAMTDERAGPIKIQTPSGAKCLQVNTNGLVAVNGAAVVLWDCDGSFHQKWFYAGSWGINRITAFNGKCLDIPGASTQDGVALQTWDCNNSSQQNWTYSGTGHHSYPAIPYILLAKPNGVAKCLDGSQAQGVNGSAVTSNTCNGGQYQQWIVDDIQDLYDSLQDQSRMLYAGKNFITTITNEIDTFKPNVILTMDPRHGYYCHPDHRNVGRAVFEAVDTYNGVNFPNKDNLFFFTSRETNGPFSGGYERNPFYPYPVLALGSMPVAPTDNTSVIYAGSSRYNVYPNNENPNDGWHFGQTVMSLFSSKFTSLDDPTPLADGSWLFTSTVKAVSNVGPNERATVMQKFSDYKNQMSNPYQDKTNTYAGICASGILSSSY